MNNVAVDNIEFMLFYAVAIRTAPVQKLVFAIRTGVSTFHWIYPNFHLYL